VIIKRLFNQAVERGEAFQNDVTRTLDTVRRQSREAALSKSNCKHLSKTFFQACDDFNNYQKAFQSGRRAGRSVPKRRYPNA
jgi:hypothetical protein